MKKGHIYTLLFMVALTGVLVFALAFAYEGFKPSIAGHARLRERRAVLDSLGLAQGLSDGEVDEAFERLVKPGELNGHEVYVYEEGGQALGYAVPITGPGLWGSISGYLGVKGDLSGLLGLVFTSQSETPGLGGRIEEPQYKEQFRGVPIAEGSPLSYGGHEDYQVDAVTGATQTSKAVLSMVNRALDAVIFDREAN